MNAKGNEKSLRYIDRLNVARSNENWHEVPELARKIEKHAPHRICLTVTAKADAQIADFVDLQAEESPDSSARARLSQLIPLLLSVIEEELTYPVDAFEATVCLGWIHWLLDEPALAIAHLPADFRSTPAGLSQGDGETDLWAQICMLKGAYIKGFAQEKARMENEAVESYSSVLPIILSSSNSDASDCLQFRSWAELLLSKLATLAGQRARHRGLKNKSGSLQAFRIWAHFNQRRTPLGEDRTIWKAYYELVSHILQSGLLLSASGNDVIQRTDVVSMHNPHQSRTRQISELKGVESTYEALLLEATQFPKATAENPEMMWWVDAVMTNWNVLSGPDWRLTDGDLDRAKADAHAVIDILYRAASKTFHSTRILRYLFLVHASVAEFDLALRAFDSFVEISQKRKSGEVTREQDSIATVEEEEIYVQTLAQGILMICRFGTWKFLEKALAVETILQSWIDEQETLGLEPRVSPSTLTVARRAVGISRAQWVRATHDANSRSKLQDQAVSALRSALGPHPEAMADLETLFALALMLAETRDIPAAIKITKLALSVPSRAQTSLLPSGVSQYKAGLRSGQIDKSYFNRERLLVPFWHLLALLLTARSEFGVAAKACEAAFDQFGDMTNLLSNEPGAVVDLMGNFERESLIQVKLTQLALTELVDGPTLAVDSSNHLFALYSRLFGQPKLEGLRTLPQVGPSLRPKSAQSTVRSVAGSILGRSRLSQKSAARTGSLRNRTKSVASAQSRTSANEKDSRIPPVIQVIGEDGSQEKSENHPHPRHHVLHKENPEHSQHHRREQNVAKKRSGGSLGRRRNSAPGPRPSNSLDGGKRPGTSMETTQEKREESPSSSTIERRPWTSVERKASELSERHVRNAPSKSNIAHYRSPSGASLYPTKPSLVNPHPWSQFEIQPEPLFTSLQVTRRKVSLLIQIWLFVAGMYTRAGMVEDAKGAIDESFKLAESLKAEAALQESSSRSFGDAIWGCQTSVDKLWADSWTARGVLAQACQNPHLALECFEKALSYYVDHPEATVAVSLILLDIYAQKINPEPPEVRQPPPQKGGKSHSHVTAQRPDEAFTPRASAVTLPASVVPSTITNTNANLSRQNSLTVRSNSLRVPPASITGKPQPQPQPQHPPPPPPLQQQQSHPLRPQPQPQPQTTNWQVPNKHISAVGTSAALTNPTLSANDEPDLLRRLAARDRAYGLLSAFTKLGRGWDDSAGWLALARAHEEAGLADKAREALWWCVELENSAPLRRWDCVGHGGFVL